jgi:CHAD domain-containing protein
MEDVMGEPRPAGARETAELALPRHVSTTDAATFIVRDAEARFVAQAVDLEAGSTAAESVHQARVALRRLRVSLRVFSDVLGERRATSLATEARWLFVILGRVRELQLLRMRLASHGLPAATLRMDRGVIDLALEAACASLTTAVASERYARFRQALHQAHAEPSSLRQERGRARKAIEARLRRWHRKARRHAKASPSTAAGQHALRKELKRLRYATELLASERSASASKVRSYLRRLAKLQDALGAAVDAHHACLLARRLKTSAALRESLTTQRATLRSALQPELARRLHWFVHKAPAWRDD